MKYKLTANQIEILKTGEYLNTLKPGERVVETGQSCMKGRTGTVYVSEDNLCVLWDALDEYGSMGTSVTWGTRRITDIQEGNDEK